VQDEPVMWFFVPAELEYEQNQKTVAQQAYETDGEGAGKIDQLGPGVHCC